MLGVEQGGVGQAGIGRLGRIDEWSGSFWVAQLEGDGDDFDAEGGEFFVECLPT